MKPGGYFIFSAFDQNLGPYAPKWQERKSDWEKGIRDSRVAEFGDIIIPADSKHPDAGHNYMHVPTSKEVATLLNNTGFEIVGNLWRGDFPERSEIKEISADCVLWVVRKPENTYASLQTEELLDSSEILTAADIRNRYLTFMHDRGYTPTEASSVIAEDETTLFTVAGMQPLVPYILGEQESPYGNKLANCQPCIRSADQETVGDGTHFTLFEMLGHWTFGECNRTEQVHALFHFFVEELGINPNQLVVTAHAGDASAQIPRDEQTIALWKHLFESKNIESKVIDNPVASKNAITGGSILTYTDNNWWSRSGKPDAMPLGEPGGTCSEIFYIRKDIVHDLQYGSQCHPHCDCGRFVEIGNCVFMTYKKTEDGLEPLPGGNVDVGLGLERLTLITSQTEDVYSTDLFSDSISALGVEYSQLDIEQQKRVRVIADHLRSIAFIASENVYPSNKKQGYFLRSLIRQVALHAFFLEIPTDHVLASLRECVSTYQHTYPILNETLSITIMKQELEKYAATLTRGVKFLQKKINSYNPEKNTISDLANILVDLKQSNGLPTAFSLSYISQFYPHIAQLVDTNMHELQQSMTELEIRHQDLSRA